MQANVSTKSASTKCVLVNLQRRYDKLTSLQAKLQAATTAPEITKIAGKIHAISLLSLQGQETADFLMESLKWPAPTLRRSHLSVIRNQSN